MARVFSFFGRIFTRQESLNENGRRESPPTSILTFPLVIESPTDDSKGVFRDWLLLFRDYVERSAREWNKIDHTFNLTLKKRKNEVLGAL